MQRFILAIKMVAVPMTVIVFVLLVSLYLFTQSLEYTTKHTTATIRDAAAVTERVLRENAEAHITSIARSAARKLDIYLAVHPELTIDDLLVDDFVARIGKQTVGQTGYLYVNEAATSRILAHPLTSLLGKTYFENAELMKPKYDALTNFVIEGTTHLNPLSAYYTWPTEGGRTVDKFQISIASKVALQGSAYLRVAATVEIEELLSDFKIIKETIALQGASLNRLIYNITQSTILLFGLLSLGAVVVFFLSSYFVQPMIQRQRLNNAFCVQVMWIKVSMTLLGTLFVLLVIAYSFYSAQGKVKEHANNVITTVSTESQKLVRQHLEREVKHIAEQAVEELDLYLELNPELGPVLSLVDDNTFHSIASEPVGAAGYVHITTDDLLFISHPNSMLIGKILFDLEQFKRPVFDVVKEIARQIQRGEGVGYYSWLEADGRITDKYVVGMLTKRAIHDGTKFLAFATAYLSDFSSSESELRNRLDQGLAVLDTQTARQFKELLLYVAAIFISILLPYIWWQRRKIKE